MDETERQGEDASVLRQAVRVARIEAAERSAMVVDLRDAEAARLEIVNEAIEPLFRDIPPEHADLFDRGVTNFHFYTMNRADLVYAVCHLLGLRREAKPAVATPKVKTA